MAGDVSKKILWIFVFLILAAIAVLGVLFIRGYHAGKQVTSIEVSPSADLSTQKQAVQLAITDPATDVATTSAKLTVSGKATPNASIVITGGADDFIVSADSSGDFSQAVTLSEGLNSLIFQAFTDDGNTTMAKKNIVYTKGAL